MAVRKAEREHEQTTMSSNGSIDAPATLISEAAKARVAALPKGEVTLEIDGKEVTVPAHYTLWQAAREQGIPVPVLCHDPKLEPAGVCRMCVVEVEGARTLVASCIRQCEGGMKVSSDSPHRPAQPQGADRVDDVRSARRQHA